MQDDKMVRMANQIATFFKSQPNTDQAQNVADHINDFWEPRMRQQLLTYLAQGGQGLDPLVCAARDLIRMPTA
jgi:formate dehydrogenase subunit delta|tara:strand:- start:1221 stop:1439 length:219 start_codon:yes stop_codon:yes gene_type:complete